MLSHHVERCAAVRQETLNLHVRNLTVIRQPSLELCCWEVGGIFRTLEHESL